MPATDSRGVSAAVAGGAASLSGAGGAGAGIAGAASLIAGALGAELAGYGIPAQPLSAMVAETESTTPKPLNRWRIAHETTSHPDALQLSAFQSIVLHGSFGATMLLGFAPVAGGNELTVGLLALPGVLLMGVANAILACLPERYRN